MVTGDGEDEMESAYCCNGTLKDGGEWSGSHFQNFQILSLSMSMKMLLPVNPSMACKFSNVEGDV